MPEIPAPFLNMIQEDIARINDCVANSSSIIQWELFREMDGRYQA